MLGTVVATGQCPDCQGLHPVSLPGWCCMVKRMVLASLPCSPCWPSSGGLIAQTQAPLTPCPVWFYLLFCFSKHGLLYSRVALNLLVAEDDLELMILLLPPPESQDCWYVYPYPASRCLFYQLERSQAVSKVSQTERYLPQIHTSKHQALIVWE